MVHCGYSTVRFLSIVAKSFSMRYLKNMEQPFFDHSMWRAKKDVRLWMTPDDVDHLSPCPDQAVQFYYGETITLISTNAMGNGEKNFRIRFKNNDYLVHHLFMREHFDLIPLGLTYYFVMSVHHVVMQLMSLSLALYATKGISDRTEYHILSIKDTPGSRWEAPDPTIYYQNYDIICSISTNHCYSQPSPSPYRLIQIAASYPSSFDPTSLGLDIIIVSKRWKTVINHACFYSMADYIVFKMAAPQPVSVVWDKPSTK